MKWFWLVGAFVVVVAVQLSVLGIVFSTGIQGKAKGINAAPDDHFAASPNRGMTASAAGRVGGAGRSPTVRHRIVSPAGVVAVSTPDDHFIAGPNCRMARPRRRCASGACGSPIVGSWIVSPASVQIGVIVASAPDDHFSASPHCGVTKSTDRRVRDAGGCPSVIDAVACI